MTDFPEEADGMLVPEHFVPTPSTVSPQAQAFLRFKPPVGGHAIPDSRDDTGGWAAHREMGERGMIMLMSSFKERYPGTVTEHALAHCPIFEVVPDNLAEENAERAILYVHGGGFMLGGGGEAAVLPSMQMAGMAATRTYAVDYRMVPDVSFPDPMLDVLDAYRFLLERHKPENIALFGASAGANLAPAALLKARDSGLPLPAACAVHSAPSDIACTGDSEFTNVTVDTVLVELDQKIPQYYADGHDTTDPYLSPVYGDYTKGFCPSILTSGTRDLLLTGAVRLHRARVRGGVGTRLDER